MKFISTGFPALLAFKFQGIAKMGGCSGNGVYDHRNKVGFSQGQGVLDYLREYFSKVK